MADYKLEQGPANSLDLPEEEMAPIQTMEEEDVGGGPSVGQVEFEDEDAYLEQDPGEYGGR